jgi:hypothetical protein
LATGEALSGISWGVFQTLTTAYASEIVPPVLRPFVRLITLQFFYSSDFILSR